MIGTFGTMIAQQAQQSYMQSIASAQANNAAALQSLANYSQGMFLGATDNSLVQMRQQSTNGNYGLQNASLSDLMQQSSLGTVVSQYNTPPVQYDPKSERHDWNRYWRIAAVVTVRASRAWPFLDPMTLAEARTFNAIAAAVMLAAIVGVVL